MKKSTVGVTIVLILVIVGLVGFYAFLTGRAKTEAQESVMTPVQQVLSRDLAKDYPATVKEVVKYYTELEKCFYNEECTEEELEQLGMKARELYDRDLLAINEVDNYLLQLKTDVKRFKDAKRRISSISVASSTNVDEYMVDGFQFARLRCTYSMLEGANSKPTHLVYLLRRDDNRRWKIYGWDFAENLTIYNNTSSDEGTGNENEG